MSSSHRLLNDPVQLFQKIIDIHSVHACSMFKGFEIGNLAFETFKAMFFENLERLWIESDYVANEHLFRYHGAPFQKGKGELDPTTRLLIVPPNAPRGKSRHYYSV